MSVDFSLLNATISAILAQPAAEGSDLVADFNARAIYSKSDWQGLVWRYSYRALDFILRTSRPLEQSKLEKSFKLSEKLFRDTLCAIDATNKAICANYEKVKVDQDAQDALRCTVVAIGNTLSSFFDINTPFSLENKIKRVQFIFEKVLKRQVFSENDIALLMRFEKEFAMASVESIVRKPMPHHAFLCLLHGEITKVQNDKLQEWLLGVKEKEVRLTPWLLHQALSGMIEVLFENKVSSSELPHRLHSLEIALLAKGCKILQKDDILYTDWVSVQSPGTIIDEKVGVRLGENIPHPTFDSQGLIVFERYGHLDQMVVLAKSVTLLGMWYASHKNNAAMVPSVKVLEADPQGRYLIIEKLANSLDAIKFRSKHGKVAEDDEDKCNEIARLIAWMSMQKVTPREEFQPEFIFFTPQGSLRTLVPLKTNESFDYNKLEQFVIKCSKGNHLSVRYIMRKSKLIEHPVALFYLKIAKEHLTARPKLAIREQALHDQISDPKVIERAETMVVKLIKLRQKLSLTLIPQLVNKDRQARDVLLAEISKALIVFQEDSGLAACDWKEAEEILILYLKSERKELFHKN